MVNPSRSSVRPTKRSMQDMEVAVPDLSVRLSDIEEPLVMKAQMVPASLENGAATKIRALTDRPWYKVKTSDWRGAVGNMKASMPEEVVEALAPLNQWWWLTAAGKRQDDSAQRDFYAQIEAAAFAAGRNTCDTDFLIPTDWDVRRLQAEAAYHALHTVQSLVRRAAAASLREHAVAGFTIGETDVRVRVSMLADGEVYMAVGATSVANPELFAIMFSSVRGVQDHEWIPEPGGAISIEPAPGEILWSTMLTPEVQQQLLFDADEDEEHIEG
jgi:hypothetical protein